MNRPDRLRLRSTSPVRGSLARFWILGSLACTAAVSMGGASCSSNAPSGFGDGSPDGGTGTGSGSGGGGSSGSSSGGGGSGSSSSGGAPTLNEDGGGTTTTTGTCTVTDPTADMDKDGWSPNAGDCNDCNPLVNPGAIDVLSQVDGGTPVWGDEDCDGTPGDSAKPCDTGLTLTDVDPNDAAKAIELCATATATDKRYGVISATYVHSDGTALASPGLQVGIQSAYGTNVHVQGGANMLNLSTGVARTLSETNPPTSISYQYAAATAPTGFPMDAPNCARTTSIYDDVALELQIRVPTNATGYSFSFKFYSFEFPDWVCDPDGYNDQFIALVTPPPTGAYVPTGSTGGNISFDSSNNPVSVNLGYFDTCDPSTPTRFATHCRSSDAGWCPATPSSYCPDGVADLAGTGFDTLLSAGPAGATRWLQTQAPATPGSTITIRFALWDAGNGKYDSSVLVDNFQWIATGGVTVGTAPVPTPK